MNYRTIERDFERYPKFGFACRHPLYHCYKSMIARCHNENHENYKRYGGRGIYVYEDWRQDKAKFFDWCFKTYPNILYLVSEGGYQLDREEVNGPYVPKNCRFIPKAVNQRNKRNTVYVKWVDGKEHPFTEIFYKEAHPSLNICTARNRIQKGWNVEKALKTPGKKLSKVSSDFGKVIAFQGRQYYLKDLIQSFRQLDFEETLDKLNNWDWTIEKVLEESLSKRILQTL